MTTHHMETKRHALKTGVSLSTFYAPQRTPDVQPGDRLYVWTHFNPCTFVRFTVGFVGEYTIDLTGAHGGWACIRRAPDGGWTLDRGGKNCRSVRWSPSTATQIDASHVRAPRRSDFVLP